jgi:alpha-ketoglutarate-dependent 2,4-dichlorophenoxyacetate dioxygenase
MVLSMSLTIRQIHPLFVGEVSGIDLRRPPSGETVAAIDEAMDRYAVLVFRGQPMDEDEQIAFAGAFGSLDTGLTKIAYGPTRYKHKTTMDISNVMLDGSIAPAGHKKLAGRSPTSCGTATARSNTCRASIRCCRRWSCRAPA